MTASSEVPRPDNSLKVTASSEAKTPTPVELGKKEEVEEAPSTLKNLLVLPPLQKDGTLDREEMMDVIPTPRFALKSRFLPSELP